MEVVKNIAAVLGVILSAASVLALISKTVRQFFSAIFGRLFRKYGKTDQVSEDITEIKALLERHIDEEKEFKEHIKEMNDINMEFTRTQCRNIIKTIFYKYKDTKILPLYEKKTLINVEELYIKRLKGNSFASLLLKEMSDWEVDYESTHSEDGED